MGRTEKAKKNIITGLLSKLFMMLLAFATRTTFIRLLGAEYTGISSLYTNILSMLSLAELGLGNVLMFYLYSALKEKDEDKINKLVFEFKKIYVIIIVVILIVGTALIPFLDKIVNSSLKHSELITYYVLYLLNSAASYVVVYRTTVLSADQKKYISNIVSTLTLVAMYVLQILYLLIFKQFIGYLIIQIVCAVANNIILNTIAIKEYPYLRKPKHITGRVIENRDLLKNIKATFLYRVSDTILDQTDSVLISMLIGTVYVGYYSNYYMLVTYMVSIAGILASGLVASFGNLVAEGDNERSYEMFKVSMLVFSVFGTVTTCCYFCIVQDFVPLWIGQEYVMNFDLVIAVMAVYYLRMSTNTLWIYRSAMGIFKEVQYANLFAALINVILSIILGKIIGLAGIIIATAISRLLTSFWYEGKVVFQKLNKPVSEYYLRQLKDFLVCSFCVLVSLFIINRLKMSGIIAIVCKLMIAVAVSGLIEFIVNYRTNEFKRIVKAVFHRS